MGHDAGAESSEEVANHDGLWEVEGCVSAPFDDTLDPEFLRQVSQTVLGWFEEGKEHGNWEGLEMTISDFHTHDAGCPNDKAFPDLRLGLKDCGGGLWIHAQSVGQATTCFLKGSYLE